jgi:hypothetical protein
MAETRVSDELWEEFHTVVNMTSAELRDWLRVDASGEDTEALPDQDESAFGLHRLMRMGQDPLKPPRH